MPDETPPSAPPIGTDAIRRVVGAARATAATGNHTPAPPPDMSSSPWASPLPPTPDNTTTPRAQAERSTKDGPIFTIEPVRPLGRKKRGTVSKPEFNRQARAWDLVARLMEQWAVDSRTSLGKANNLLSQRLGESGVILLREGIPMGSVADLVRLCNELARDSKDGGEEDKRITQMQADLKRMVPDHVFDDTTTTDDEGESEDGAE